LWLGNSGAAHLYVRVRQSRRQGRTPRSVLAPVGVPGRDPRSRAAWRVYGRVQRRAANEIGEQLFPLL